MVALRFCCIASRMRAVARYQDWAASVHWKRSPHLSQILRYQRLGGFGMRRCDDDEETAPFAGMLGIQCPLHAPADCGCRQRRHQHFKGQPQGKAFCTAKGRGE